MSRDIWPTISVGLMVLIFTQAAFAAGLIEFTNKVATFTNLQGEGFRQVSLVRGDLDGVVWRSGTSGGRVCYTNLHPALLQDWGIPTNRIQSARARAEQKTLADARYRAVAAEEAQARAMAKAKETAAWEAGAAARALQAQRRIDQEAIESLHLQIEGAKSRMRKAQAVAHDYNKANSGNRAAPRLYIKETERVKIKEAEEQLKKMHREFSLKYGKIDRPPQPL
jgi:hypothetical protein